MPYPGISEPFILHLSGFDVKYSLSTILFFFSTFRMYTCFKILKFWNFYSNDRTRRILNIFKNINKNLFLLKANLKSRPFLFLIFFLAICIIYVSVFIFRIFEYFSFDYTKDFFYEYNSIWYFIITVTGGIYIN
jgi:hypothetical protein